MSELLIKIMSIIKDTDRSCTCCGPTDLEEVEAKLKALLDSQYKSGDKND